jgi:uncharacterized membrane protein YidH (DUF202 family)
MGRQMPNPRYYSDEIHSQRERGYLAWSIAQFASLYFTLFYRKLEFCLEQASIMEPPPRTATIAAAIYALVAVCVASAVAAGGGEQPLSRIAIHRATVALQPGAFVDASLALLGLGVSLIQLVRSLDRIIPPPR